ncbi:unnamed protein product [Cladocopium goreaui]|uniref:Developmentally-regulated G-protein 1 (AtDRG1) (Developmentally-regulated G-protein 2A) (AtDRG2a) n=1 Tax=Cladocopium goreaui TaxID=2562237 RepID=A0A9P1D0E0_9DINO|nr:unnamed protein product [Cladocopium goreaui]
MASMTLPELSVEDLDAPNPWSVTVLEYRQTARGVIGGLVEATRSDKDQLHSAAAEKWAVDPDAAVALANPAPGLQIKHPDWRLLRLVLHQPGPAPSGAKPVPVCWFSATPEPIPAKMHKDVTVRLANDSDWPQWEALFREYRISQIPGGSPPFTDDKTATDAVWALCADAPPPSSKHGWRGRLLVAYSSSLFLGAAHVILQPRPSSVDAWDAENPQAWRGFLQDIFVAPAASGNVFLRRYGTTRRCMTRHRDKKKKQRCSHAYVPTLTALTLTELIMASYSKSSAKAGSNVGGGGWAKAKHQSAGGGGSTLERIQQIELEISRTQKNKATAKHLGELKAKLCKLKRDLLEPSGGGGGKCAGFEVQKIGDARIGLVGFPSVGKSSLLTALTGVQSEAAAYEFTTLTCIPGVIYYNDVRIQLLDLPGLIVGASTGKGRGRQVIATAKSCDIILMVLDPTKDDAQKEMLTKELENVGIRLNRKPPDVTVRQTKGGGLKFQATVPLNHFDEEVCATVLKQYKMHNADVLVREDITVDDFIDVIDGNRKYCKCIYVYNKIDLLKLEEVDELARRPQSVVVSVQNKWNYEFLLRRLWDEMEILRVYTKKKGQFPDFSDPIIITPQRGNKQFTVENAVLLLHKSLLEDFKHALVWGSSVKQSPQVCGKDHILHDEDVIQIVKLTSAEKAKALHGKKTGALGDHYFGITNVVARVFLNRLIDSSINPELPWAALMAPLALRQHTKVISQLGSLGTWTKVLQLLGKMRSMRVQPNVITYNSSIHACGRSSVWQHALALLDEMKQASLQPAARLIYHDLSGTASEGRNSRRVRASHLTLPQWFRI